LTTWTRTLAVLVCVAATAPTASAATSLTQRRAEQLFRHELADRGYTALAAADEVTVDCRRLTTRRYRCKAEWRPSDSASYLEGTRGYVTRYSRGTDVTMARPRCTYLCRGDG
jgi:hypothetical protein